MIRIVTSLVFLVLLGCQDTDQATVAVEPKTPPPNAPNAVKKPPEKKDDCSNMHQLLVKCSGNQRLRTDGHFKRVFINNCRREVARDTAYAKRFGECAGSKDCPTLDTCSKALEKAAGELGPEHLEVILTEGRREEAKKFCFDNAKAVEASAEFHDLCHPLLEEVEKDKAAAKDDGCPFHDHH